MAIRVLIAGLVGGIVLFLWGGLYHMALPLGEVGVKELPNEQAVLAPMKTNLPDPGLYLFPGSGLPATASHSDRVKAMQENWQKLGPHGALIYHPIGGKSTSMQMVNECLTNFVQALLAAFLLAQTGLRRFASRVGFVFVIGILAAITTNISYWNWYGFPTDFTLNQLAFLTGGYLLVGIAAGAIVKGGASKSVAAAA